MGGRPCPPKERNIYGLMLRSYDCTSVACALPEVRVFGQSECGDIDGRLHPILDPAIVCCLAAPCHSRFACVAGVGKLVADFSNVVRCVTKL